jgi:hypothetical protein
MRSPTLNNNNQPSSHDMNNNKQQTNGNGVNDKQILSSFISLKSFFLVCNK